MNLSELKQLPIADLVNIAQEMGVENTSRMRKQDIIFAILKAHALKGEDIHGDGVLEVLTDGFGFLRSADGSYLAGLMTFTSLPVKSDVSVFVRGILFLVKSAPPKTANAILLY